MRSADITFVVLTRNEESNIGACLQSLLPESPKIVYDAGSTDATAEIARARGAVVHVQPWQGFLRARAAAAALVTTPWTFMVDADERLTADLRYELVALNPAGSVVAYSIPRRNWFGKKWIRGAGWWPDRLIRLFRTGGARVAGQVHERWIPDGAGSVLQSPLEHYSYPSIAAYRKKFADYTALEGQFTQASFGSMLAMWLIAPLRFLWLLFARRGVLDGWQGVFVCGGSALYPAVAATKSWRLRSRLWR